MEEALARILLAEDDHSLRNFLAVALQRAGHEVRAVDDGLAAADALEQDGFDLLLADVVMPGLDGIELARRAGKEYPNIKIMFITGFAAVAMSARSAPPKGARVLSKPFHLRELVGQVESFLAA
jgi:two-component system cell cycle response regulator CpdR